MSIFLIKEVTMQRKDIIHKASLEHDHIRALSLTIEKSLPCNEQIIESYDILVSLLTLFHY